MKIIIIEDEFRTMQGLVNLIHKHTHHTVVGRAKNGLQGIELVKQLKPDLIITDIKMPEMDGIEMITELTKMGERHQTIILSGFSDFPYAQQAIKLGVKEYLLKPITLEDMKNSLYAVEQNLKKNMLDTTTPSIEELFKELASTNLQNEQKTLSTIETLYNINGDTSFTMFMIYCGATSENYKIAITKWVKRYLVLLGINEYYIIQLDSNSEIIILLIGDINEQEVFYEFNHNIIPDIYGRYTDEHSIWGVIQFKGVLLYREHVFKIRKQLKWSIVLDNQKLLICPVEDFVTVSDFQYPFEVERALKKVICTGNRELILRYSDDFLNEIVQEVYLPDIVTEAFIKHVSALFLLIQEFDTVLYERLEHANCIKKVMGAITFRELSNIYTQLIQQIVEYPGFKEDVSNYTIKKALDYIRNNYQDGITLEETADRLEITPEYLSTLFNREVGMHFSHFIKEFRVSKAKKLLLSSDMKIYEIAEKVGYNDSKYFCRVFKEIIGLSPSEYKLTNT